VSICYIAFFKPQHKSISVRIGDVRIGDSDLMVLLSVMDIMTLAINWYLLRFQRDILDSSYVTFAISFIIFLLVGIGLLLFRQIARASSAESNTAPKSQPAMSFAGGVNMKMVALALKNIRGSGFRSIAIFLAVMGVAGFLLATTLIIAGAQYSLDSGLKRLGADILVVPEGAETKVETALLMGKPTQVWMPRDNVRKVANVPGVAAVSPQIFLASMFDSPCCSVSEMFIVVYDPATDFTLTPWLEKNLGRGLKKGEVIGGTYIFVPEGFELIELYGYEVDLLGVMEPTGTGIDQTLFMGLDTALEMSKSSRTTAMETLNVDASAVSTIMVKVAPGADTHRVAVQISKDTDGMVPIESPKLFGAFRKQMTGLLWGFFAITVIVWAVTMVLIGIVFSMAANERRREMAVLRAVGATRSFIFRSVLTEAILLALGGAFVGIAVAAGTLYAFKDFIAGSLKMPFLFPSIPSFIGLFSAGVALAIVTVTLSALLPALRLSRQELAVAMRE
jgi:putative ABC transport system permease protein